MLYLFIIGFFIGIFIPAVASRFGKIELIDPGNIILQMWHRRKKITSKQKKSSWYKYWKKKNRLFLFFSVVWGLTVGLLFVLAEVFIGSTTIFWTASFITSVCFLILIDKKHYILPDFFTIPLLLLGIASAYWGQLLPVSESLVGAFYGYIISVIAVLMLSFHREAEFGAGDVKMLTALGAWLGLMGLMNTILLSFVFFFISSLLNKRNWGAYGPSLGIASLLILFNLYAR